MFVCFVLVDVEARVTSLTLRSLTAGLFWFCTHASLKPPNAKTQSQFSTHPLIVPH